jgi:hypothetical protein
MAMSQRRAVSVRGVSLSYTDVAWRPRSSGLPKRHRREPNNVASKAPPAGGDGPGRGLAALGFAAAAGCAPRRRDERSRLRRLRGGGGAAIGCLFLKTGSFSFSIDGGDEGLGLRY